MSVRNNNNNNNNSRQKLPSHEYVWAKSTFLQEQKQLPLLLHDRDMLMIQVRFLENTFHINDAEIQDGLKKHDQNYVSRLWPATVPQMQPRAGLLYGDPDNGRLGLSELWDNLARPPLLALLGKGQGHHSVVDETQTVEFKNDVQAILDNTYNKDSRDRNFDDSLEFAKYCEALGRQRKEIDQLKSEISDLNFKIISLKFMISQQSKRLHAKRDDDDDDSDTESSSSRPISPPQEFPQDELDAAPVASFTNESPSSRVNAFLKNLERSE